MTDYEQNKKLTAPVKSVLESMRADLEGTSPEDGELYENNFYFGYGKPETGIRWAEVYVSPET